MITRATAIGLFALCALLGASHATADRRTLHEQAAAGAVPCEHCHSTTSWKFDFARASSGPFDHSFTGFPLTGRHAATACLSCHQKTLHPSRACASCHADQHQGRFGDSCDRCHGAQSFDLVSGFTAHKSARLPLTGMHALLDCSTCHARDPSRFADTPPSECYSCHSAEYELHTLHPPHRPEPGNPARPGLSRDCRQCHNALAWSPALFAVSARADSLREGLSRRAHARSFPIDVGPHRGAECGDCHQDTADVRAGAGAITCTGCHAHSAARIARSHPRLPAAPVATLCLQCHARGAK